MEFIFEIALEACVLTSTPNLFLKYKGSQIIVNFGVNVKSLTFCTFHYNIAEHCFFSNVRGIFS